MPTVSRYILIVLAVLVAALDSSSGFAADRNVSFSPLNRDALSPERGFYRGINDDFSKTSIDNVDYIRSEGSTVVYALVRLDPFRAKVLPADFLSRLDLSFAHVRKSGLKVVLRFAYNYPQNERDYLDAKDASLAMVKTHIAQLAPVVARNRDVIVVMQAGFIGAWGEGHTSSNGLDTASGKRAVISELLAKMPASLQILWRYPADLFKWHDAKIASVSRVGLHNDCFLSSPTDVGTYSENAATRATERSKAAAISRFTFYMGETCGAEPDAIRSDCSTIEAEGKTFNVSSLNRDYYEGFISAWKANGCYGTVERSLGYRLRIESATLTEGNQLSITIVNEGWARPLLARRLALSWRTRDGTNRKTILGRNSVRAFAPGARITYRAQLSPNTGYFCIAAPDPHARLTHDPRYAIRFANANVSAKGQIWETARGRFCFKV